MDDPHDFEALVRRHQGVVCAVAYSLLRDRGRSEEVAQEAFLIAWQKLPALSQPPAMPAWLCGIARNLAANAARRKQEAAMTPTTDATDTTASPLDAVLDREANELAHRALAELDDSDREVVTLYYRNEQSIDSVASALGITAAAARQRLHRGRERLKSAVAMVERTLHSTRPTPAFTAACIAGLAATGVVASSAHAGNVAAHGSASGTASPWFGPLAIAGLALVTIGAASALGRGGDATTEAHTDDVNAASVRGAADRVGRATANGASVVRRIDANARAALSEHIARATTGSGSAIARSITTRLATADEPWEPASKVFDFAGDVLDGSNKPMSAPRPGPLNKSSMRFAIRAVQPLLYECYTTAAKTRALPSGTIAMTLRLVGDDQGTLVDAVRIGGGDDVLARDAELGECMRETLMTIELPPMPEPGAWDVYYPFTFH